MLPKHFSFLILFCCCAIAAQAQVVIGTPAGSPDPSAVLELRDTTRGLLLPRMSLTNMNAISSPANGLLVYNTTYNGIYQYNQALTQWRPIVADSSEWYFDPSSAKLYLRRALNNADSFYYNTGSRKFMYADTRMYRTSTGGVFNLDEGNSDRFIFKTTASRFPRPATNLNSANLYSVYEVDDDTVAISHPFESSYYGVAADVTVLPSATQRVGIMGALRSFSTFAGTDTASLIMGLQNQVTLRGKGREDLVYGINNIVAIRDSVILAGQVVGIQNNISYVSPLGTPRIEGNLYGYFSSFSTTMNGKVDGNAFGIFLGNVNAAGVGSPRNWAIFTNKGQSRFGDSLVVTEGSAQRARAVFDVNSTTAMIVPAGTSVQRPATGIAGMLRYNNENGGQLEYYNGTIWTGTLNKVQSIDLPLMAASTSFTQTFAMPGATTGSAVSISPANGMPDGFIIAWARVSAANTVEVKFSYLFGAPADPAAQNFYITVTRVQ